MGSTGRNCKMLASLIAPSSSVGGSGGVIGAVAGSASGNNTGELGITAYSSIPPNLSTGVPCFSASVSSNNAKGDLTEVPLLIE